MSDYLMYLLFLLLGAAIGWFACKLLASKEESKETKLPELNPGERFAVIKPGQSNITIVRRGKNILLIDEEGQEIAFKKTIE